ncbi:MAG: hypothetical protein H6577_10970 [Lewinellaceae bacterium]|nr:hypothetical protein [Saprospiraceae bacterium]MCB9338635.1 hypothetical protein [Lewinellaceae bacterium]
MVQLKTSALFACIAFLAAACTEDPPPTLLYKDREIIDSLFKIQVDSLRPRFDSLCNARFDSAVQYKVDSIMRERQAEIQKYLERIKREIDQATEN